MLKRADEHVRNRTLYEWGGGHGKPGNYGLDCSGLIIDCAKAAGFVVPWNSNGVWQKARRVEQPEPADVALYGSNDKATHIVLVEYVDPVKGIGIIGANGGGHLTTTPEIAIEQGAFVKRAPLYYRPDVLGFCTLEDLAQGKLGASPVVDLSEDNWG